MELTTEFTLALTIFLTALALTIYTLAQTTLPPPTPHTPKHQPPTLEIRENTVTADRVVRIWIVAINEDGKYTVTETNTPATLPSSATFVAVFTGRTAIYRGEPPPLLNGYVCAYGIVDTRPRPPYILVRAGRVVEVVEDMPKD